MTAQQLIDRLRKMPPDAEVFYVWDGEPRSEVDHVYLSRDGRVMLIDVGGYVYSDESRPEGAPARDGPIRWGLPYGESEGPPRWWDAGPQGEREPDEPQETHEEMLARIWADPTRCHAMIPVSWGEAICADSLGKDGVCPTCARREAWVEAHGER